MLIRNITADDKQAWSKMRTALWPDTDDQHLSEIDDYFRGQSIDVVEVLILKVDEQIAGFLELNLRNFAEGSRNSPVPYVEAWYVKPEFQNRGYGKQLMQHAERWARQKGYAELASDTESFNEHSISLHKSLGFTEVERVVCFLKKL